MEAAASDSQQGPTCACSVSGGTLLQKHVEAGWENTVCSDQHALLVLCMKPLTMSALYHHYSGRQGLPLLNRSRARYTDTIDIC